MRIAVAGDWHGDSRFAKRAIEYVSRMWVDAFFHVGDFGLGLGGRSYLEQVSEALSAYQMKLVVTLGNHDDWDSAEQLMEPGKYVKLGKYTNILLAPRVGVVETAGVRVAHVSGAVSVDQGWRTAHVDWWPQEALTDADQVTAQSAADENDGKEIHLVVCHESPASVPTKLMPNPPTFWKPYLGPAHENRIRLERAISTMIGDSEPILVHGHHHIRYTERNIDLVPSGRLSVVEGLADNGEGVYNNIVVITI